MDFFFDGLTTADEVKQRYRELAKLMHPDVGGTNLAMQELNEQYKQVMEDLPHPPPPDLFTKGATYQYLWRKVSYRRRTETQHIFQLESGCWLYIDTHRLDLIKDLR